MIMLQKIIKPWWAIVLMGVLFIICAILIFNYPTASLLALAFWLGWLVMLAGIAAVASYFSAEKDKRQMADLLIGIATIIVGLLMISKAFVTAYAIIILFSILMGLIGIWIVSFAWRARSHWSSWWIAGILGCIAIVISIKSFWDFQTGAESISSFLGIGVLFSGIGLLVLGFMKRKIVYTVSDKIHSMKEKRFK